jgi:predicted amidohydrolase YtcJ
MVPTLTVPAAGTTALCALALLLLAAVLPAAEAPADLVLRGGRVHTVDPQRPMAEAVAVRGNRVVAVGGEAEVASLVGPKTKVVELGGRTVVPGFDDAHAHLLGVGYRRLDLDLTDTESYAEVVQRVAAAAKARRPGEWIRGRGWHEGRWKAAPADAVRGFPVHAALSAAAADNPVVLERADGHATLANARAMALSGITRQTQAPAGGEVIRDPDGEPTGVFVDNAGALLKVPARDAAENARALELAMDECLSSGVTSLSDAGAPLDVIELYRRTADAGRLRTRLYVMAEGLETMRALGRPEIGRGLLTVRAVKVYADGALGSRGAALLEPYSDDPGNTGLLVSSRERLLETARYALDHGFQAATHAIGDRANRVVLDVYEQALRERPQARDARFRVEHAQLLDQQDVPRFAKLGVIASMQTVHCPSDRPWATARLGAARISEGAYAWRKLLASGARLVNGTDAPVESLSPIENFHAAVTRQDVKGRPPGGFDPDQKLTRAEALRAMTHEAAYASFEESQKGMIAPGRLADLVVLSQDILAVPDEKLMDTRVLMTIVDGRVLYESR